MRHKHSRSQLKIHLPSDLTQSDYFRQEPFVLFEIEKFLSPDFYESLRDTFPDHRHWAYKTHKNGRKCYLDQDAPEFSTFIAATPPWRALHDVFSEQDTCDHLYQLTKPYLGHRPGRERGAWRYKTKKKYPKLLKRPLRLLTNALARLPVTCPVRLRFEFSWVFDGASIPPHNDTPRKLLSLMLYFPDYSSTTDLGTEFYCGRPGRETRRQWDTGMMNEVDTAAFLEEHECFYRSAFTPNKLVGFIKTDASWHAVPELRLPGETARRSLNINIYTR